MMIIATSLYLQQVAACQIYGVFFTGSGLR